MLLKQRLEFVFYPILALGSHNLKIFTVMAFNCISKIPFHPCIFIFLSLLLLACENDADLFHDYTNENGEVEKKTFVSDDNFRIPSNQMSILDVFSNDLYISNNTKIVATTSPANGHITINENNTITYTPAALNDTEISSEQGPPEESGTTETEEKGTVTIQTEEDSTDQGNSEESTFEETITAETSTEEPTNAEEPTPTEEPTNVEEVIDESVQEESTSTDESPIEETTQDEGTEQVQEDTFTYTTETENEDGTVTTETGTVTVEVDPSASEDETPTPLPDTETDFWRDPIIAGTRLLDEKYYDLDTGEIYPKEVNLQRGQVMNYIEHENCPQRIKDKWADRIEIGPEDVNGSEDGLQAIFDAYPKGTLFFLRAGVYQDQKNAVLRNDQDVVGEYGAILDGSGIQGDSEEATRAIRSMERGYICNLRVREYPTWNDPENPKNPRGAALETIENGAILNCEVHSHNEAIAVIYGSKALWNKFTAGRLGIYGYGYHEVDHPNRRGSIVKYNEWYNCNFNDYDPQHEAGGSKFVMTDGAIWSHNYIHDNPTGSGIWNDIDNREAEIYNNVIINTYRGIFIEISHTANIHHNTIEYGTGFGGIYLSNSQGNRVHNNFVRWCENGITIRDKERGTSKIYPGQIYRGINNEIDDNHIWQRTNPSTWTEGVATLFDGHIDPDETSNSWHGNRYFIDDNAEGAALFSEDVPFTEAFMYSKLAPDSDHVTISWEEWKNKSGDTNSSLEYKRFF